MRLSKVKRVNGKKHEIRNLSMDNQDLQPIAMAKRIKLWSLRRLKPYERNARTHSSEQIDQVAASILKFGFTNPILIDSNDGIIAGHGRYEAAKRLGLEKVPVVVLDHLNDEQRRAYIIADNKLAENAGWDEALLGEELSDLRDVDFELEVLGFSDEEIEELLEDSEPPSSALEEEITTPQDRVVTQAGDLWYLGKHRVLCGDSTESADVTRLMGQSKMDMVFADPPYGVSYSDKNEMLNKFGKGNRIQKEIKSDHLPINVIRRIWTRCFNVWLNYFAEYNSYYVTGPGGGDFLLELMTAMNESGWPARHLLIWNKNNHVLSRSDYHHKHETIIYGWTNKHRFYGNGEFTNTVWDIEKPQYSDLHPTMKPVRLIENCLLNSTKKGHIVADMFLGSGSTLIACQQLNRHCYGMEFDPAYVDVIIRRWQKFSNQDATHQGDGRSFAEIEDQRRSVAA